MKKGQRNRWPFCFDSLLYPRQEPGRNFKGMSVPSAVEPQRQPYRAEPTFVRKTAGCVAVAIGTSVTFLPSIVPSLKPCAVTVIAPSAVLVTDATYFVVTLACDVPAPVSQPQPFTPGGLEALRDW